jgi:thymidylate kinase
VIVNIRGTSGSGKTTIVRKLMERFGSEPIRLSDQKIEGHQLIRAKARIVGRYNVASGGCDQIKTQEEVRERIKRYTAFGHVVFEGLLISHLFSKWKEFAEQVAPIEVRFVYLTTPLEECLRRIRARRLEVGNLKPLNPSATENGHKGTRATLAKMQAAGLHCYDLDDETAFKRIAEWIA